MSVILSKSWFVAAVDNMLANNSKPFLTSAICCLLELSRVSLLTVFQSQVRVSAVGLGLIVIIFCVPEFGILFNYFSFYNSIS